MLTPPAASPAVSLKFFHFQTAICAERKYHTRAYVYAFSTTDTFWLIYHKMCFLFHTHCLFLLYFVKVWQYFSVHAFAIKSNTHIRNMPLKSEILLHFAYINRFKQKNHLQISFMCYQQSLWPLYLWFYRFFYALQVRTFLWPSHLFVPFAETSVFH